MTPVTPLQWKAYELTHPDHQGLSLKEAAEEMGVTESVVGLMMCAIEWDHPDLFIDISSHSKRFDRGVSQFGGWCEDQITERF